MDACPIDEVIEMPNRRTASIKDKDRYEALRDRKAKEVGIPGRSKMDKGELIDALRHH